MSTCFYNGVFINTSNFDEIIGMLIVENGKISYKGKFKESLAKKCSNKVNLDGKTLIPGFNDSHMHLLGLGIALDQLDLSDVKSISDLINKSKVFIKNKDLTTLEGRGWNQKNFIDKRMPTRKDLDKISTEIPIVLKRACGHILVCNSKALDLIDDKPSKVSGGEIDYNLGILRENGMDYLLKNLPIPSKEEIKKKFINAANYARKKGITSVQSDDLSAFPKSHSKKILNILKSFKNQFPLRIYEQSLFRDYENFKSFINDGYEMTNDDSYVNFGPLKILLDGALGSETAYMSQNYLNSNSKGILMYDRKKLDKLVSTASKNNIDVAIHAIGDGAISNAINSIKKSENKNLRHSIIHCQITTLDLIKKIKKNNILLHIQPIFLDNDVHIVESKIGKRKTKETYMYNTMDKMGIKIAFGSDSPVDKLDPILGIHCAVNRTDLSGKPEKGFLPEEKISIKKALKFYTLNAAYAEYMEDKKGSLDIDKYADFTILDKNILKVKKENIKNIKVVNTYLNGKSLN